MRAKIVSREVGQSLVLIALLMFGIIAFLGLVLDGGGVYANRRRSQDASDSAAFAGVRALALRSDDSTTTENSIWITATNFATANGVITTTDVVASFIDASGANLCIINSNCGGVPTAATGVRVTTTLALQPYFISVIIGNAPIPIQAVAAAQSGTPGVGTNLMPMTMRFPCNYDPNDPDNCTLTYNQPYQLQGSPTLPGGFQWASYDCLSSSPDLVEYLTLQKPSGQVLADKADLYYNPLNPQQYNLPGPPSPNPWICSGPGGKFNNNISDALDCWIDLNGTGCWQPPWGPKPAENKWTIPIFDHDNSLTGSTAQYHTVMFAQFQLLGYWFGQNQCNWVGKTPSQKCNQVSDLPPALQSCATTQDPNEPPGTKIKCIMGQFLKEVVNLQIAPGKCNSNGLNVCGFGLSQ